MKDKAKKKPWVKRRHSRVFAFLRILMRPICKLRYRYTARKSELPKGAYLILSNHQTTMDPFFVALSFKFPIYYVASDDIFNLKVSPLINYLVAPIPKSKSMHDVTAMRSVYRVVKEGGAVGIFPEGNRTLSGGQWEMTDAIAKLAKMLKVPLVLYNLHGGYGTDPRWGHSLRKGKFFGEVKRVMAADELAATPVEKLFEIIKRELAVDDTAAHIAYKSGKRAEYIERALYVCPACGGVSTFVSHKSEFKCTSCGTHASYTPELTVSPPVNGFDRIYEWFEWEKNEIVNKILDGETISDSNIIFRESVKFKRKKKLDGNRVSLDKNNLTVYGKRGESAFPLDKITAITMVGKKKFNFYFEGKILQIKGNKRFCAIKYVHAFDGLRDRSKA